MRGENHDGDRGNDENSVVEEQENAIGQHQDGERAQAHPVGGDSPDGKESRSAPAENAAEGPHDTRSEEPEFKDQQRAVAQSTEKNKHADKNGAGEENPERRKIGFVIGHLRSPLIDSQV